MNFFGLEHLVIEHLEAKALAAEVTAQPNYHKLLYSVYSLYGDYREGTTR